MVISGVRVETGIDGKGMRRGVRNRCPFGRTTPARGAGAVRWRQEITPPAASLTLSLHTFTSHSSSQHLSSFSLCLSLLPLLSPSPLLLSPLLLSPSLSLSFSHSGKLPLVFVSCLPLSLLPLPLMPTPLTHSNPALRDLDRVGSYSQVSSGSWPNRLANRLPVRRDRAHGTPVPQFNLALTPN